MDIILPNDSHFDSPRLQTDKQVCRLVNHPDFETHGEGHTKSKTGAISGPTK